MAVSLNGQQFSGAGPRFNYYDVSTPPRVHRIDPRSGPLVGGTLVTVNGWNVANVPTLTCRWLRNGTSEVLSTVPATFVSTAAATCVAPAVGMAVGSLYAYVQLANSDSGSGYSTEIRNEYTYTTSSPEISTAWGIGTPPGLSGTHVAGAPAQVQARAYDGLGNPQSGGGDAFSVTLTHGGNDEIVFESEQEDLNNGCAARALARPAVTIPGNAMGNAEMGRNISPCASLGFPMCICWATSYYLKTSPRPPLCAVWDLHCRNHSNRSMLTAAGSHLQAAHYDLQRHCCRLV